MRFSQSLQRLGGWLLLTLAVYALWTASTVQVDGARCDLHCKQSTQSLAYLGTVIATLAGSWLLWRSYPDHWRRRLRTLQRWFHQSSSEQETATEIIIRYGQKALAAIPLLYVLGLLMFSSAPDQEWSCSQAGCSGGGTSISGSVFYLQILPLSAIGGWLWWSADRKPRQVRKTNARSQRCLKKILARNPHGWIRPSRFAQGAGISVKEAHEYLATIAEERQADNRVEATGEVAYRFSKSAPGRKFGRRNP